MARILLGVSGGIAAYKSLELVRLATAAGHAVRVVQTPASRRFVGAASFAALTGAPVLCSEFERDPAGGGVKSVPDAPSWRGLRVLVTAGGTREPIDSVRFIGNSSSGRMGIALARGAHMRGADVTLLAANVSLPIPAGVECRRVVTAA